MPRGIRRPGFSLSPSLSLPLSLFQSMSQSPTFSQPWFLTDCFAMQGSHHRWCTVMARAGCFYDRLPATPAIAQALMITFSSLCKLYGWRRPRRQSDYDEVVPAIAAALVVVADHPLLFLLTLCCSTPWCCSCCYEVYSNGCCPTLHCSHGTGSFDWPNGATTGHELEVDMQLNPLDTVTAFKPIVEAGDEVSTSSSVVSEDGRLVLHSWIRCAMAMRTLAVDT